MTYTLSEYESKQLLADAGIPIPEERLVSSPEEAVKAADEQGYPVALKLCGRGIAHKTERNLVRLDVADAGEVRRQAEDLLAQRGPDEGDADRIIELLVAATDRLAAELGRTTPDGSVAS